MQLSPNSHSGIDSVGEIPWGSHLCQFYKTGLDLADVLVPYFKAGLERGEQCLWITSDAFCRDDARAQLREAVSNLVTYEKKNQIEIFSYDEWYQRAGKTDVETVLKGWVQRQDLALANGYNGLRLSGDTFWLERNDWAGFEDYERRVNETFRHHRIIGLCTYCLQRVHAEGVLDVVRNHDFAIARRKGEWETIENASLKLSKQQLHTLNTELEQKVAERTHELETSRNKLRLITDSLPSLISLVDRNHHYRMANAAYMKWFGIQKTAIEGHHVGDVLGEEAFLTIKPNLDKALSGESVNFETEINYKGVGKRHIHASYIPIKKPDGSVDAIAIMVNDLTKLKNTENALRESENIFRSFFSISAVGMGQVDPKTGRFIYVNSKMTEMTGYSMEELLGKTFREITHPEDRDKDAAGYLEMLEGKSATYVSEKRYVRKDGSVIWVDVNVAPVRDDNGNVIRTVSVNRDISARKSYEQELRMAKEKSEEANKAKTHFLANMSHEIRTPIGVIQGFADLLHESKDLSGEKSQWVETIRRNARQLTNVIGEILDVSKVESNLFEIEKIDFSLTELIEDINAIMKFKAEEKGLAFSIRSAPDLPDHIHSDPTRLRQILINLIGNAVKFTERGRVMVDINGEIVDPAGPEKKRLKVVVTDTGIGIAQDKHKKIFEPFIQADSSMKRRFGGTGLGLSISRRLAKALDGDLVISSSEPGKGSTFVLTVCCLEKSSKAENSLIEAKAGSDSKFDLKGKTVLLVEDSIDNQALIARFLGDAGVKVDIASDGEEGADLALAKPYDLVLMDIQMPKMDGYEAIQLLRSRGFGAPIVAITAHALKQERDRAQDLGFQGYLTKPVTKATLYKTVSETISRT